MQNKFSKIVISALVLTLLAVSLLPVSSQVAMAASLERCQNSSTGSTNGFLTWAIGAFRLQTNRWNTTNVTPNANYNLCVTSDDALTTGDFEVTVQEGSAPTNAGPTSYPSIIAGCHWVGVCSPVTHGMPIQYSNIASIPSNWAITTVPSNASNPSGGKWDASYDIWLNPTAVVSNPTPTNGQNSGAEIMIWLDSRGYSNANPTPTGAIRPTGNLQAATFSAAGFVFDVWVGRLTDPVDGVQWNVVSFVRRNAPGNTNTTAASSSMIGFDAKTFIDQAATYDCPNGAKCVNPSWFLLSIQAGFEPWVGGGAIKGAGGTITTHGLTSTGFTADANAKTGGPNVITDRHTDDGRPIEHWQVPFTVTASGCPNSTPTLTISELGNATNPVPNDPPVVISGASVVESPAGSGNYTFNVPALFPMHGDVNYTVTFPAGCSTPPQTTPGYIDPSGRVRTPAGDAVGGATVTLFRSDTATGTFTAVPAGSAIMSPANRSNPDTTGKDGSFGWDVTAGFYKVRAEKAGCTSPTNPAQTFVETPVLTVPPAVTDIDLRLNCPASGGTGLPVTLTKTTDWTTGYCANVTVTNNTSSNVNWNVNFSIAQFGGGTIYTFWNAVYTQSGSQISNVHANPANPWNLTLHPGESTHDVGFCANR